MNFFDIQNLLIIANIISLIYNIPQVMHTIKSGKADDLSGIFLFLRLISGILWIIYSIYIFNSDILISWLITTVSSVILLYYKFIHHKLIDKFCNNNI